VRCATVGRTTNPTPQSKEPEDELVRATGCRDASNYSLRSSRTSLSRDAHFGGNVATSAARCARHARRRATHAALSDCCIATVAHHRRRIRVRIYRSGDKRRTAEIPPKADEGTSRLGRRKVPILLKKPGKRLVVAAAAMSVRLVLAARSRWSGGCDALIPTPATQLQRYPTLTQHTQRPLAAAAPIAWRGGEGSGRWLPA
jgi:hypothetical protein